MSRYNSFVHRNRLSEERSNNRSLQKQVIKDKKLKKELRRWIKQENIQVPVNIKGMIGYI